MEKERFYEITVELDDKMAHDLAYIAPAFLKESLAKNVLRSFASPLRP